MPDAPTHKDATAVAILAASCLPSLIILTRKKGLPLNTPTPVYTFDEASELLAKWAETAPDAPAAQYGLCGWMEPDRVEVELFFGAQRGTTHTDDVVNLIVPLKRAFAESGYDLRLHLKRFAANLAHFATVAASLKQEG